VGSVPVKLSSTEQALLLPEIAVFMAALHDPLARARYQELREQVEAGEIADDFLPRLATILEIGLQSGRIRQQYGADGEQELTRLFHRTPAGAALAAGAAAVTEALAALHSQVIDRIQVTVRGPGSYSLLIDTDRCQISISIDRGGVRVENVAIGV